MLEQPSIPSEGKPMKVIESLLAQLPPALAEKLPDVKLQDQDIRVTLAQEGLTRDNILPPKLSLADFTLSFDGAVEATVRNFNSPGDVDENGVVGEPAAANAPASEGSRPQLLLGGNTGWMRYQATARIKSAGSTGSLPFVSGQGKSEVFATLSDYRAHPLTRNMREAAKEDLSHPRLLVLSTDLTKLGPGDAVAWQVRGTLEAGLELNWADLFTTNLANLAFVRTSELIELKTALDAKVGARVSLTDDYQLVFSRPAASRIQLAVRKAKSREATLGAGLNLQVELADAEAVRKRLGEVLTAITGQAEAKVEELVDKALDKVLSAEEQAQLRGILERLGLDPQLVVLDHLKQEWAQLKQKVSSALDTLVKARVAASFQYEYLRVSESSTLLEVELDEATALRFHGSLLRGSLVDLLAWLREPANAGSYTLRNYLNTSSATLQSTVGFTLGLGSFEVLKSRSTRKQTWVNQENFQGARRQAFLGQRAYEDSFLGHRGRWVVDFRADMEAFTLAPTAPDFRLGLHMLLWGQKKKLSKQELREAVDDAVVWGVLDANDAATVLTRLDAHVGRSDVETQLEIKVSDDMLREFLPRLQGFDVKLFSRALARAMPWSEQTARVSPEFRKLVYAPIWESYLNEVLDKGSFLSGDLSPTLAAQIAQWFIERDATVKQLASDLLLREKTWSGTGGRFTFAEVTQANSGTLGKCRRFVAGLVRLRRSIDERRSGEELRAVHGELEGMWNTGFHLRAAGALLAEVAKATPRGLGGIERTFTVRIASSQEQLVFSTAWGPSSST
ncbi:hypothetical protein OWM54_00015 [Myxococcus sp. MISCRS1]|uniref:hypothetical protein n=1 Tax=Myxococcus sp. MISCRS1 TaxID=2996786 RepID=UPI00226E79C7|nr:hypothetical protein [Myxococcus sp. MISCRS1]MCY0995509.1 hypothetical protein [Myxococcus sp. MISCRS1]